MRPYCSKCGMLLSVGGISIQYVEAERCERAECAHVATEHLRKTCGRCGFSWCVPTVQHESREEFVIKTVDDRPKKPPPFPFSLGWTLGELRKLFGAL